MRVAGRVAAIVLAGLAAAACGVDGTAVRRSASGAERLAGMLGRLPAVEGADGYVVVNLHAVAREAGGLSLPDPADTGAVNDYRRRLNAEADPGLFVAPTQVTGTRARTMSQWEDELGFHLLDVDADGVAGLPPEQVEVVEGSIDPAAVEDAVRADPVWSDLLEEVEHGGSTYWSWGEAGGADVSRITPAREVGESRRLAAEDGAVAWTRTDTAMEATLDAWHGDGPSLAEDEDLAELAAALDGEGCHSAFLSTDETAYAGAGDGPALPRYDAFATGVARDEDGTALVVAFRYTDTDGAQAGAAALGRVVGGGRSAVEDADWSDLLADAEVRADGRVVVGVFRTDHGDLWRQLPFTRDTLLSWA